MKISITDFADRQIEKAEDFLVLTSGFRLRRNFRQSLRHSIGLLQCHPNLGPVEPLLADLPIAYRSLVVTHIHKIVYAILDDTIHIVDLWDVRRDPSELVSELKRHS